MQTGRRDVLRTGGAVAAAGAAIALGGANSPSFAATRRTSLAGGAEPGAWRELTRSLSPAARLYGPGQPEYAARATADNQRYAYVRPAGVLVCATESDVQTAVRWCVKHGVPLAPRSGGHNYAGYSTTPGLVISLRAMKQVVPRGQ
ncbi:FAD-binding oxidoreductase [Streptomyces umbrinus]|uniref:FAD-binding oxidoreductase n=1 Tax=Streptomyces umbrinus TaxID=67370 RepID=UPI0034232DD1